MSLLRWKQKLFADGGVARGGSSGGGGGGANKANEDLAVEPKNKSLISDAYEANLSPVLIKISFCSFEK